MKTYLTKRQAALRAGVSTRTIDRWRQLGLLTTHKAGPRLIRIDPTELVHVAAGQR